MHAYPTNNKTKNKQTTTCECRSHGGERLVLLAQLSDGIFARLDAGLNVRLEMACRKTTHEIVLRQK